MIGESHYSYKDYIPEAEGIYLKNQEERSKLGKQNKSLPCDYKHDVR